MVLRTEELQLVHLKNTFNLSLDLRWKMQMFQGHVGFKTSLLVGFVVTVRAEELWRLSTLELLVFGKAVLVFVCLATSGAEVLPISCHRRNWRKKNGYQYF